MAELYPLYTDQLDQILADGESLLAGFDALRLNDRFRTVSDAEDYFQRTPFEDADSLFSEINRGALGEDAPAQIVDISRHNFVIYGNQTVQDSGGVMSTDVAYIPAAPILAAESLGRVYDAAKQLEDPRDAGLLLRMGIYLTQRYVDCNSRSAAIVESLRMRGYDGSSAHRLHYASLAQGSQGMERLGRIIDTEPIQVSYANTVLGHSIQQHKYDGSVPSAVTPFNIEELAATRLDLPQATSVWAGRLVAEHAFGLSLTIRHALVNNRLGDYIIESGVDEQAVDAVSFFTDLDSDDITLLHKMHDTIKVGFLDEISRSFTHGVSTLGNGHDIHNLVEAAKS